MGFLQGGLALSCVSAGLLDPLPISHKLILLDWLLNKNIFVRVDQEGRSVLVLTAHDRQIKSPLEAHKNCFLAAWEGMLGPFWQNWESGVEAPKERTRLEVESSKGVIVSF